MDGIDGTQKQVAKNVKPLFSYNKMHLACALLFQGLSCVHCVLLAVHKSYNMAKFLAQGAEASMSHVPQIRLVFPDQTFGHDMKQIHGKPTRIQCP